MRYIVRLVVFLFVLPLLADEVRPRPSERRPQRRTSIATNTVTTRQQVSGTNDAKYVEPTVVSAPRSYGSLVVSAYMKFVGANTRIVYRSNGNGASYTGELALPSGAPWASGTYTYAADPVLVRDTSGRIYCVGLVGSDSSTTTGIAVWTTTSDYANSWSAPIHVASVSNQILLVDKPWITVASGNVYVTYTNIVGGSSSIYFSRATAGSTSFSTPVCASRDASGTCTAGSFHASTLVADAYGYLYMFYLDRDAGKIRRSVSTDLGNTWWNPDASGYVANVIPVINAETYYLPGGMKAPTTLSAAYSPYTNRLALVWHAYDGAEGQPTELFIATKGVGEPWTVGRLNILGRVGAPQTSSAPGDQFFPSVAADPYGGLMVNFCSRHATGSTSYRVYDVYLDSYGNQIVTHPIEELSTAAYPPGNIGDYQWISWNDTLGVFDSIWIANAGSTSTVWRAQSY